jgi:DNA-binding NtrC family response regulator
MRARILVVDDHRNTRDALELALCIDACQVRTASNADEALAVVDSNEAFDLIACDIRMPGMSGIDLGAEITRRRPDARIVMMTAHQVVGDEAERIQRLGIEVLIKPVTAAMLLTRCGKRSGGL